MVSESVAADAPRAAEALPLAARVKVLAYLGGLALFAQVGAPYNGLIDVPISFLLKNKLHLAPHQVADFRLVASIPLYFGFVFGFARDRWDILGRKDRGMLMVFGGLSALAYIGFAFVPMSYGSLVTAVVLCSVAFLFALSAQQGLAATIGQQHVMTGQVSTIASIFLSMPFLISFLLGGMLSQGLETRSSGEAVRTLFLVGAALMAAVAGLGALRPRAVFDNLIREPNSPSPWQDLKRLLRHRPVYPALIIWFLWSFAPGSVTPAQYHLQNHLHATDAQWGEWNALFGAGFLPTYVLYGWLCNRVSARKLLFWGTIVAIPQWVPLAVMGSINQALLGALLAGLVGGVATAAYTDLIIRSCPKGLQGVTSGMAASLFFIAARFGDVLGTWLYERAGGFGACVAAITLAYASILIVLRFVPPALVASADGEGLAVMPDEAQTASP